MESSLRKLVVLVTVVIVFIYWFHCAGDPTMRLSIVQSASGSVWLSRKVKGPRHKRFLSKPHLPSWFSLHLVGHKGEFTLLLFLLSGDTEVKPGPVKSPKMFLVRLTRCLRLTLIELTLFGFLAVKLPNRKLKGKKVMRHRGSRIHPGLRCWRVNQKPSSTCVLYVTRK